MDTLFTSDWAKMENLLKLLQPFAIHTDWLQRDSQSLVLFTMLDSLGLT